MDSESSGMAGSTTELRHQTSRLETLNEIGRVMSSTLDLPTLYETIYQQIGRVLDASQFFLALHREADDSITVPYLREEGRLILDSVVPFGSSMTSTIIRSGTRFLFHTAQEYDDRLRAFGLAAGMVGEKDSESGIFVPLHTGSRTIGAVSVQSTRAHAYTTDDMQMLSVLASQAAVAIENARLYAESEDNVRQMQALLKVARTINASLDLATVLDSILTSMREVLPYYFAAILLPDPTRGHLDVTDTVGPFSEERRVGTKIPFGRGITGRVFETGNPLLVNDVSSFDDYIDHNIKEIRAEMAVPLKRGDAVIGVVDVERTDTTGFSQHELSLLSLFASQAAIAIENARLYAEQQRRVHELQAIQSIVQQLTPLHDERAVANVISQELTRLIDYNICGVFRLDPHANVLVPIVFEGADFPFSHIALNEGLTGWVGLHGSSALVRNSDEDPRLATIPNSPDRVESLICAPLIYEGRVRGVITLSKLGSEQFDENSLRLLEIIAAQTAIAFDRARLYTELRTEAVTDPLTRLYNRRYLLERLSEERSRARRNQHPLLVLLLDLDRFKTVNDRYGHDAGDVVLVELARLLRGVMRAEDVLARYGGEEFCVLLPELSLEEGLVLAERLRAIVATHAFPAAAGVGQVTVSVGLAAFDPAETGTDVVSRADRAMYAVKAAGGNGVSVGEHDGCATNGLTPSMIAI
jgi:diguanylate cyclase (GGDEF)-like protein